MISVADNFEHSYPQLKNACISEQKCVHVVAWGRVNGVESSSKKYQIQFSDAQPQVTDKKL